MCQYLGHYTVAIKMGGDFCEDNVFAPWHTMNLALILIKQETEFNLTKSFTIRL